MNDIVEQVGWIRREVRRQTYAMIALVILEALTLGILIGMDLR